MFLTLTCNVEWPSITRNLEPGQTWKDRPDLTNRVFKLYLKELLHDINVKKIFGEIFGNVFVVEFQKRGLPHAHLLTILKNPIKTRETLDKFISAEIPGLNTHQK